MMMTKTCKDEGLFDLVSSCGGQCAELHDRPQRGHGPFFCHLHFHTRDKAAEVLGHSLMTKTHQ